MQLAEPITRWWKAWGLAITIIAVVVGLPLLFVTLLDGKIDNFLHQRRFETNLWKNQKPSSEMWPLRLCMVDDLLASGRLRGATESQILELLGTPDSKDPGHFYYYLGPERGFIRIDSETLVVEFGADGKVTRPSIYRD